MRTLLVALSIVIVPAVAAQTASPLASSASTPAPYVEVGGGGGYASSVGPILTGSAAVGYRLPSGLAIGVHATSGSIGTDHAAAAFGPEVRYSRALDARTTLDVHASGTVGLYSGVAFEADGFRATGVGARLGGSATRRFGLGRGVTFAATGGLYGGVSQTFESDLAPAFAADRTAGLGAHGGVIVGAQVEFEVLGGRLAIGPYGYVPVVSTGGGGGFGTGVHRAGGGPGRGFITFTF